MVERMPVLAGGETGEICLYPQSLQSAVAIVIANGGDVCVIYDPARITAEEAKQLTSVTSETSGLIYVEEKPG